MGTIWLVRHGLTAYGEGAPRYCGVTDPPLSETGQAQARALARRLADRPLVALYTSGLQRAVQTAAPLAERLGLAPRLAPGLHEQDYGAWEGLTDAEITARDPALFARYVADPAAAVPPGGEALDAVARRAEIALAEIAARHAEEEIVVVAHKTVNRVLLCHLLLLPPGRYRAFRQDPAALNRIIVEPHRIVVAGVNDTCHLQA